MATKQSIWRKLCLMAILAAAEVSLVGVVSVATVSSAQAQFFDRYFFDSRGRRGRWFEPQVEEKPADYSKAPGPVARKTDVEPTAKIVVFGDTTADYLAYGLEDALADNPEIAVLRKHKAFSGLIRYETRNDAPEWAQVAREVIAAEKPNLVIMMLGVQDRQTIREKEQPKSAVAPNAPAAGANPAQPAKQPSQNPNQPQNQQPAQPQQQPPSQTQAALQDQDPEQQPSIVAPELQRGRTSGSYEFRTEKWEELYSKRIDDTIAALKTSGVPVLWVGLPSIRGTRSTSEAIYLNELYRSRAERAGIMYIDVWDGFVDESGRFTTQGPDVDGQVRRLRTPDGVHFTKFGARKLAHFIEREINRGLLTTHSPAVAALPAPSEPVAPAATPAPAPKTGAPARPLAGPVLLLTAPAQDNGELLGASGNRSAATPVDPLATRVLVNGEATQASAGRADDFSWPPRAPNTKVTEPLPPSGAPIVASANPPPAAAPASAAKPATTSQQPARSASQSGEGRSQQRQANSDRQERPSYYRSAPPPYYRSYPPSYHRSREGFFGLFR